jgi:hypothetical protein
VSSRNSITLNIAKTDEAVSYTVLLFIAIIPFLGRFFCNIVSFHLGLNQHLPFFSSPSASATIQLLVFLQTWDISTAAGMFSFSKLILLSLYQLFKGSVS